MNSDILTPPSANLQNTLKSLGSSLILPLPQRKLRIMMLIRRGHLYLGLFLFPWVLLYGISAFLFNHSELGNDQRILRFSNTAFIGTPMESMALPNSIAEQVISELNKRAGGPVYRMDHSIVAAYEVGAIQGSELIFGSMTFPDRKLHILMHVSGSGGAVRIEDTKTPKTRFTTAPFAVDLTEDKSSTNQKRASAPVFIDDTIDKQALASIPGLIKNLGFNAQDGIARVTQVPDLVFQVEDSKQIWQVRYNSFKGMVTGKLLSEVRPSETTLRSFLTRLHTIHGYPFAFGPRWVWTVVVDLMAALMVYWAFSGILMWWQVKSTRKLGMYIMAISVCLAGYLGFYLYQWMAVPM